MSILELAAILLGCALFLGVVAMYMHHTDPESIDEEEDSAVEHETPEQRQRAFLQEEARKAQELESSEVSGFSE